MVKTTLVLAALVAALALGNVRPTYGVTFTVTTTANAGAGSLRQAILDANASVGLDSIGFNIPSTDPGCNGMTGVCTISPLTALPTITSPVTIDGYTQPGASPNTLAQGDNARLLIELNGANSTWAYGGLYLAGSGSTIRGLVINRFSTHGITIDSTNNIVEGNFIGTDATGTEDRGSYGSGVVLGSENRVGGTDPAARNIISGNHVGIGIALGGGNIIQGNYIGTDRTGTKKVHLDIGADRGITLNLGSFNVIGGTEQNAGNLISGNGHFGIEIIGYATFNTVQGNLIGTDVTGTEAIGNGSVGIHLSGDSTNKNNLIGGALPGAGNVISGNAQGIEIVGGLNNRVLGNLIGTQGDGVSPLGNGPLLPGSGINLRPALNSGHKIGGPLSGEANVIAYNRGAGILFQDFVGTDGSGVAFLHNSIYANGALGIDLGGYGVTANDPGDADEGPNDLQNHPLLSGVTQVGDTLTIDGSLNSVANTNFQLEFFYDRGCDASGHGEGQVLIGSIAVNTDAAGNAAFSAPFAATLPTRVRVSATATNPSGSTSEFSRSIAHPAPDPDTDCDGFANHVELGCGSAPDNYQSRPERLDGFYSDDDGDFQFNEPLPPGAAAYDCDGDGYKGSAETSVFSGGGNGDQDPCGTNGWPSDLVPGGIQPNTFNIQDLGSFIVPVRRIGTSVGDPEFDPRWDLVPGSAIGAHIAVTDIAATVTGASGFPPMFGGLRAYGKTCPWGP